MTRADGMTGRGPRRDGIDPGERRVGVALSDPLGIIASPFAVLDRRSGDFLGELKTILVDHEVTRVVVGLPVSLSGEEGRAALRARELGETVGPGDAGACGVP